ncbi:BTAD domain-containing putative transcriptional regulator [Pseudonocardia yunnanensis]|uniref:BTAD domain-containing putative transcriptional regulator n=1 Tax=Pseudonocardia yunnanensis TaxID=58107 RepID=A0ABW4EUH2_9PSEU
MESELGFALLGPVRAWRGGSELPLGTPQQRATLALLLLQDGTPTTMGEIADALWGETLPAQPSATIRTYFHRIRRLLATDERDRVITVDGGGYRIEVDRLAVDVGRFCEQVTRADIALEAGLQQDAVEHLRTALSLHQGTPLAGLPGAFVQVERARLSRLRWAALESMCRLEIDRGGHARIVDQLQAAVVCEPLREPLHELLILALYRCDRQAEAFLAYENARRVLREELGTDPGPRLRRLHHRMLSSDPGLRAPHQVLAPPARPAQLPTNLPVFVGRETALAAAGAALPTHRAAPEQTTVIVISGMAGVGKTAFALHWAHEITDRFPDGQLYVNLRGFDAEGVQVGPQETILGFLHALGVHPQRIPPTPDAQSALYRSLLLDRRCLIVLDNARDSAHVLPLLPGRSQSLVLITSRTTLDGLVATTAARTITLDLLDHHTARELLARRLGTERVDAEPDATNALINHCARLPLALSIVAARITAQPPTFPLAHAATQLFGTHHTLDAFAGTDSTPDIRAVLTSSYALLTPGAARLFRLLALHPGSETTATAAASAAAVPVHTAGTLLRELAHAHLVTETSPGRFGRHDLLRAYASERITETEPRAERDTAFHRLATHYLQTADRGARLVSAHQDEPPPLAPGRDVTPETLADAEQAIRWFDTERPTTLPLLERMAAHGLHSHAWRFAWALRNCHDRQGHWHELAAAHRIAARSAAEISDTTGLAYALRGLARADTRLGRYDAAQSRLDRALALFEGLGDVCAIAYTLRQYAWLSDRRDDPETALAHATRARHLFRTITCTPGEAAATNAMGWYLVLLGKSDNAVGLCRDALELLRSTGERFGQANAWESLGMAYHQLARFDEALASYRRAAEIYREFRAHDNEVETLIRLRGSHLALSQRVEADDVLRRVASIRQNLGLPSIGLP